MSKVTVVRDTSFNSVLCMHRTWVMSTASRRMAAWYAVKIQGLLGLSEHRNSMLFFAV